MKNIEGELPRTLNKCLINPLLVHILKVKDYKGWAIFEGLKG